MDGVRASNIGMNGAGTPVVPLVDDSTRARQEDRETPDDFLRGDEERSRHMAEAALLLRQRPTTERLPWFLAGFDLFDLPRDVIFSITGFLSVYDFFRLAQVSVVAPSIIRSDTKTWEAIRGARDGLGICAALQAILTEYDSWQPALLRVLSRKVRKIEVRDRDALNAQWERAITVVHQADTSRLSDDARAARTRDLLISAWYGVQDPGGWQRSRGVNIALTFLCRLPTSCRPSALEEMLAETVLIGDMAELPKPFARGALLDNFCGGMGENSPRWSTGLMALMSRRLLQIADQCNIAERMHCDFGATQEQGVALDDILVSVIARYPTLRNWQAATCLCDRWRSDDEAFLNRVLKRHVVEIAPFVRKNLDIDDERPRDNTLRWALEAWPRLQPLFSRLEADTLNALGSDLDKQWVFWRFYHQTDVDQIGGDWRGICAAVRTQAPWQTHPVLMHRLANTVGLHDTVAGNAMFDRVVTRGAYERLIGEFAVWRDEVVAQCRAANQVKLAARADAALIQMWANLVLREDSGVRWTVKQRIGKIAAHVFSAIPIRYWGDVLDTLTSLPREFYTDVADTNDPEHRLQLHLLFDDTALRMRVNFFLRDPASSAVAPSDTFSAVIVEQVAKIWEILPDCIVAGKAGLVTFCDRFDLRDIYRNNLEWAILHYHVRRIAKGELAIPDAYRLCDDDEQMRALLDDLIWQEILRDLLLAGVKRNAIVSTYGALPPTLDEKLSVFLVTVPTAPVAIANPGGERLEYLDFRMKEGADDDNLIDVDPLAAPHDALGFPPLHFYFDQ
ncbi:hypothetical protein [Robbsia andropogonis]|uniref:hypothetical protein n=2 Tax=Robbsia andropogonis TaxID=28092 RepID=UPI00209E987E|nr:hypothetical protein [Robbsia andropogonis]MCP1128945.1 hypothetical protein [Robbsia andropogonis]